MKNQMKGAVFDMDGLLLDTEYLTYRLCKAAAAEMGFTLSLDLFKQTVGLRSSDTKKIYEAAFGAAFCYEDLRARNLSMFWAYIEKNGVPVKKGAFALLSLLRKKGIACAVATSTSRQTASKLLALCGIAKYMDAFVYGDMVQNGKPAPDIFLKACSLLGLSPAACAGFEDSYNGIRAVYRAGMAPVMIPDMLPPTPEMQKLTYAIYKSLEQAMELFEK